MTTYFELRDMKDVRIVKEVMCGDHLVNVGECGCLQ